MRMPFQPLASQRRSGPAAQAKSRTVGAVKRQVLEPAVGRWPLAIASAFVIIAMASLEPRALARRAPCWAVHATDVLRTVPVAATTTPAGKVSAMPQPP